MVLNNSISIKLQYVFNLVLMNKFSIDISYIDLQDYLIRIVRRV